MSDTPTTAMAQHWREENSPRNLAIRLIEAKFGGPGPIPEMVSIRDCMDLMLQFGEFEAQLAEAWEKLAKDALDTVTPPPIIIKKP